MQLDEIEKLSKRDLRDVRPSADEVAKVEDPWDRLRQSDKGILVLKAAIEEMTRVRRETIFHLYEELGVPGNAIADELGLTTSTRIRQLVGEERKLRGLPNRRKMSNPRQPDPGPDLLRKLREENPEEYDRLKKRIAKKLDSTAG